MFDLNSPEELFHHINRAMESYSANKSKKISELFFLIMALNHLREWIAPQYNKERGHWPQPKNAAERFSQRIYEQTEFDILRRLCNGTKHLSSNKPDTSTEYGLTLDDWGLIGDVVSIDDGPPSAFYVDGNNIENLLKATIAFYYDNWFDAAGDVCCVELRNSTI